MDPSIPPPQLTPVGEKSLPAKCKADLIAYCPTMDLIALVTEDDELHVFRLNGQKVLGGSWKGDPYLDEDDGSGEIRALEWKHNGRTLAIACADSTVRLISAFSGKSTHNFITSPVSEEEQQQQNDENSSPKVTCLGWGVNFTDSGAATRHLREAAGQLSVEDLLSLDYSQPSKAVALLEADLPRELALLDVEGSFPRLSTLPSTGSDDDLFSSRQSLDVIFHSAKKSSDAVDVLVVGYENGFAHIRIFDCFEIGLVKMVDSEDIIRHVSHPLSSTHALVSASDNSLRLHTLDLRFITRSGRYLPLLAHKTTQLQVLLRYICQVQRQIELEWKNAQELPARYMRSVNQDLEEKCHCDFVTAAYHLVVTGDCFEPVREFLVDIVGERGHKRWEKAVASGYEIVRRLTHECLLPALERCEVLISRLIGLSKFQKLSEVLGLETSDLNAIVETLDCLHLLSHNIIVAANEELTQFHAFSRWLRHQIDLLSAEPMSQTLEELMEKTDLVEYPLTLKYIRGAMTKSSLLNFIQQLPMMGFPRPPATAGDKWTPTEGDKRSFYDMFKKLLEQQSQTAENAEPVQLPKLHDLTGRLELQSRHVFDSIARTQRRAILHRTPLDLHQGCDKTVFDSTMRSEEIQNGENSVVVYIASRLETTKHLLYIYRVVLDLENGVSSTREVQMGVVNLQRGTIQQVQFVEGNGVMVLWSDKAPEGSSYLLQIPFQSLPSDHTLDSDEFVLSYHGIKEYTSDKATDVEIRSPDPAVAELIKHQFPPKARPLRVDVNGRKGRRAVCVLYAGALRYEVLDLDAAMGDDDEEEEEEDHEDVDISQH
ncbi:anaphase-promoting complex, cyclosome, subunit 4-domain-containing protein [Aspergillus unguis]